MEFIPFYQTEDENLDTVLNFTVKNNSEENPKIYYVKLTLDELNDCLLVREECECKGFLMRKGKIRCKHLAASLEIAKKHFTIREDEVERKAYEEKHNIFLDLPKDLNTISD